MPERNDLPASRDDGLPRGRQPHEATDPWSGYSADPRRDENSGFRASDRDRARAADVIAEAYAEGRVTHAEYDARLDEVMAARTLGELRPLVADVALPLNAARPVVRRAAAPQRQTWRDGAFTRVSATAWLVLAVILNVIYGIVSVGNGHFDYYWPIWPMFGTAIPAFLVSWITHLAGVNPRRPPRDDHRPPPPAT